MVEKTVKICDVCNKSIARNNCTYLRKDICLDCSKNVEVENLVWTTDTYYD